MAEFINKIKTAEGKKYDIRDKRVDELPPIPTEADIDLKVDAAKSRIEGNSLVIPEQEGPQPVITIDGVSYFHKQEFDLEEIYNAAQQGVHYNVLNGRTDDSSTIDTADISFRPEYSWAGVAITRIGKYHSNNMYSKLFAENPATVDYTSRSFVVVDSYSDVDSDNKIALPTCSAYYGFLSEDGKTFISYYNLKGEGTPAYVDSVKQGNAVIPLRGKDVRLPDASSEDQGKMLYVNYAGKLEFRPAPGGTRLFKHTIVIHVSNIVSPENGNVTTEIVTDQESPYTGLTNRLLDFMFDPKTQKYSASALNDSFKFSQSADRFSIKVSWVTETEEVHYKSYYDDHVFESGYIAYSVGPWEIRQITNVVSTDLNTGAVTVTKTSERTNMEISFVSDTVTPL